VFIVKMLFHHSVSISHSQKVFFGYLLTIETTSGPANPGKAEKMVVEMAKWLKLKLKH